MQKDASKYLNTLWEKDPFHAKWTIVASAYTSIRDLVGKDNASLNEFLNLICPEIGIIGVDEYLPMLNWTVAITSNGLEIRQESIPDLTAFAPNISHSTMTEKDLIIICGQRGYISVENASNLAAPNSTTASNQAQQGLLASAPVMPQHIQPVNFRQFASTNPAEAAAKALGIDVNQLLQMAAVAPAPYQWTGSMPDLYNPYENVYDPQSIMHQPGSGGWGTFDIGDPQALDNMLESEMNEVDYLNSFSAFTEFYN